MRYERRRQRRSSCRGMFSRVHTHHDRYARYSPTGRRVFRRRCRCRSPGNLRRYTHTRRGRVTHLFPSRRCRYCCAPPHHHDHRPPPPPITPATTSAASVRFLRPHCRWYLSDRTIMTRTTPVPTEDRFWSGGGGGGDGDGPRCCQAARSAPSLLLFCFVIFLSVNHETIVTKYFSRRHAKPPNS